MKFKVFVLSKYTSVVSCVCLCMAVILLFSTLFGSAKEETRLLPIYSVETQEKKLAVTFDCAWTAEDIPAILKTLDEYNCKATFFVVGTWAEKYPDAVRAMDAAGHEVAGHSYNHDHYMNMSQEALLSDMDKCDKVIFDIINKNVPIFRAPYGEYNDTVVSSAHKSGRTLIQWDVDSLDWKSLTEAQMKERILPKVSPGSILLFHNGTKHTASALPGILSSLCDMGYSFCTASDLLCDGPYSIDHTGRQIPIQ